MTRSLFIIVALGLSLRLLLATVPSFNFDMEVFRMTANLFHEGIRNIYQHNPSYTYSPAIFYIVGTLHTINQAFFSLPYPTLQRLYIIFIDILTLLVLLAIAKTLKISKTRTAIFYFFNPVTIISSGYHAQFDNNAMFFLLLGAWYFFYSKLPLRKVVTWSLLTLGLLIKHILPFQILLTFLYMFKNTNVLKGFFLFTLTGLVFLSTFIPFYNNEQAKFVINEYIIGYQGQGKISGISAIINLICPNCAIFGVMLLSIYKYLFIFCSFLFMLFLLRHVNLLRALLLSILALLTFAPNLAAQYFVLAIPLGALFPSRWFFIYTFIASIFLMLFQLEAVSLYVRILLLNLVWLTTMVWFTVELINSYRPTEKVKLPI